VKLIVGLGNPGPAYEATRHNVGFDVVDILGSRWNIGLKAEKFHGWFGQGESAGERVALLKPTTWMNRSGQAVLAAGRFYKLEVADLLVVTDDMALPLGKLRVRASGSAGGHNGLQSVIDYLGSQDWSRLRVGIGEPVGDPANYVLTRFAPDEKPVIEAARKRAADAVECWVSKGPQMTMNRFNIDATGPSEGPR